MTATFLQIPFPVFFDSNGDALDNGYIYIGRPNENPVTDPIEIFYDADLTIPAAQPLRTIRGRINQGGSPGNIYADLTLPSAYSMTVLNKNQELVFSVPQGTGFDSALGNLNIIDNTITTINENGDIILDPNGTGEVVIQSDLGVGTDDPTFDVGTGIEIQQAGPATLRLENSATSKASELRVDTNVILAGVSTDQNLILQTNNADRLTITNTGAATFAELLTVDAGLTTDTGNITTNSGNISTTSGTMTTAGFTNSGITTLSGAVTCQSTLSVITDASVAGILTCNRNIAINNLIGPGYISFSNIAIEAARLTPILGGGLLFGTNTSATQRMRLTNNGSLEVNGSSAALTVSGLSNSLFMYYETNNREGIIGSFDSVGASSLSFRTSATNTLPAERLNIDSTGSFQLNGGTAEFNAFVDDDNMGGESPSATAIASQQSIKAYVDSQIAGGIPTGVVWDYAGIASTVPPAGWLLCDGSIISTTTYEDLYAVISTTYNTGGEPPGTFRVPDLRGTVIAGLDNMGGTAASRLTSAYFGNASTLGTFGGVEGVTLTTAQIPAHSHSITSSATLDGGSPPGGWFPHGSNSGTAGTLANIGVTLSINSTGGGLGHTNVQPTMVMYKIIKT